MKVSVSMIVSAVALAAACHGGSQASDPNMNGSTLGTPGMYFRAVPLLAPSTEKSRQACAGVSTQTESCRSTR